METISVPFTKRAEKGKREPYEDVNSTIFIDRYGVIHDTKREESQLTEIRLGAFLVICSHGHILLTCPPWAPMVAELPGGGVDAAETVDDALRRELMEETAVDLPDGVKPIKAGEYYVNFCAEDVEIYYRYMQKFYYYDLSDLITPKEEQSKVVTPEGSTSFWWPLNRIGELKLRFGHKHIIEEAAMELLKQEKTPKQGVLHGRPKQNQTL